jgi:hypothetical protein
MMRAQSRCADMAFRHGGPAAPMNGMPYVSVPLLGRETLY